MNTRDNDRAMSKDKPHEVMETHQSPFSELMLRWLAEGDLQDEAADKHGVHKDGSIAMRGTHLRLPHWLGVSPESRRQRLLLAGAALISVALIFAVRRYAGHAEAQQQDPVPAELAQRVAPAARPAPAAPRPELNVAATQGEPEPRPSDSPTPQQQDALKDCRSAIARENAREALKTCGAAANEAPDSPAAVVLLARANLLVGHQDESLRLARHALKMNAKLPDAYLLIGSVQQSAGDAQNARSAYETYLRLSPAGRYAADVRAVLRTL